MRADEPIFQIVKTLLCWLPR